MNNEAGQLIEPQPVSFSFDAPGWYLVGSLIIFFILIVSWFIYSQYRRNRYRYDALKWLQEKENQHTSTSEIIYEAVFLLKRIAIMKYGRREVAAITGQDWIVKLNSACRKS